MEGGVGGPTEVVPGWHLAQVLVGIVAGGLGWVGSKAVGPFDPV